MPLSETPEQERERLQSQINNQLRLLALTDRVATDILVSQTGVEALEHFAEAARGLIGARYCAIGVASLDGTELEEFITAGLTDAEEQRIGARPRGAGVLGLLLERTDPLRLKDLTAHAAAVGVPPGHPTMHSFLGVPIRHGETVLGSIYLTEKAGGFQPDDELTIQAVAMHLAVAIRNLQLLKRQRALVAGLLTAQEEERRAVAYDLHDGLTQYVMAAQMHLDAFRHAWNAGDADGAREDLEMGMTYLRDSVVESRRLVNGLRSLALDDMGLAGALEQLVQEEKGRAGWDEATYSHNLGGDRFSTPLETAVYRVAQEALTNIRKHAAARRVRVTLLVQTDQTETTFLSLEVRDWGKGFLPNLDRSQYGHVGLHGIAERVRLLEGEMILESEPGKGTRLRARFPLFEREEKP